MVGPIPSSRSPQRLASGQSSLNARSSHAGDALVVRGQHQPLARQHVRVHEAASVRAEAGVEPAAEANHLVAQLAVGRKQALALLEPRVGVAQDLLGLSEHALVRHQHRDRPAAARPPRGDPVDPLDVALLAVFEPGPLERPARLLAEVADRDRDEAPHAPMMARAARQPQATATGTSAGGRIPVATPTRFHALIAMIAPIRFPSSCSGKWRAASA